MALWKTKHPAHTRSKFLLTGLHMKIVRFETKNSAQIGCDNLWLKKIEF